MVHNETGQIERRKYHKRSLRLKEVKISTEAMRNHSRIMIRQWHNQSEC